MIVINNVSLIILMKVEVRPEVGAEITEVLVPILAWHKIKMERWQRWQRNKKNS